MRDVFTILLTKGPMVALLLYTLTRLCRVAIASITR